MSSLAAAENQAKLINLQDIVVEIMKTVCEAARFTQRYIRQRDIGAVDKNADHSDIDILATERFLTAQSRSELDGFEKQLKHLREIFREAMLLQVMVQANQLVDQCNQLVAEQGEHVVLFRWRLSSALHSVISFDRGGETSE